MSQTQLVADYKQLVYSRILNKTGANSISKADETNCFTDLADLTVPNGILTGLGLSLSGNFALVAPGTWKIDGTTYATLIQQAIPIDTQDATYSRYDVLYVDDNNQVQMISGALSLTPFEPPVPDGTIKIGSVLIAPTVVTINPPVITDYVNTTSNQSVAGLKNFMDGIQSVTMPLGDNSLSVATTAWVQNELADTTVYFSNANNAFTGDGQTSGTAYEIANPVASQTGNAGKFLTTDGTHTSWATVATGGGTWGSITGTLSAQTDLQTALNGKQASLGFTPENVANKATNFSVLNNTLYPTTQAVNNFVELVDTILTGMVTTVATTTATTTAGTYRISNITYTLASSANTTIPAQDATQYRYTILYINSSGVIAAANGALSSDPVPPVPSIPGGTLDIAEILIPPIGQTITVGGGGKKGTGTVTSVSSTTTDILVASPTTTPKLTLNKINGTTISYYDPTSSIQTQLNSKLSTISGITAGGDLSGTYPNPTVLNSAVLGKVLTGLSVSGSTIVSTDSIITAFGKLQSQINGIGNGLIYKGTWNASTNTPTITSGVGTTGWFYKVSVAGTTSIDGTNSWSVGDILLFDGSAWDKLEGPTSEVSSFNTRVGAVTLTTADVNAVLATSVGTITTGTWQGSAIADAYISSASNWNTAYNNRIQTFTTTGSSGASTWNPGTGALNIPTYTLVGLGGISGNQTITLSGAVTGSGATAITTTLAASVVGISNLSATGTPSSTTYLRGDNTWATISSGGISSITTTGTYEAPTFSSGVLNVPNLWPRVWEPLGTILTPDLVADASNLQEPCVIYEGSPQIITDATNVYKMLFTAGGTSESIYYAESVDGQIWSRRTTAVIANHARTYLLKVGSTYYCFCVASPAFTSMDVYSSSDMITWTAAATGIITTSGSVGWNHQSLANMAVYYDGTTYHMLLSANAVGGGPFTTGYYHSTSITSGWTAYGSNPVMGNTTNQEMAPGYLTKIGSTFYAWMFGDTTTGNLPTDIYRYSSPDMQTWTAANSGNPTYLRTTSDEGVNESGGQVANPCLVEVSGKTHLFFSAVSNGSGLAPGLHLKHAIANYTMANLVTTNEGNGGALNYNQPLAYSRTASDINYIPNAKNVNNYGTWTDGAILMGIDATAYGLRMRYNSTTTTFNYLIPDALYFYKAAGVTNSINPGSSGFSFSSWGGITFNNGSGSGAASLGNFDNTGLFTTTNGVNTQGGGFLMTPTAAFGASVNVGLNLQNASAATSGTVSRWSPAIYQVGTAWTGSASQIVQFLSVLQPVSGTNPVTYNYLWKHSINFAGNVDVMKLNTSGTLSSLISGTTSKFATHGGKIKEYYTDAGNTSTAETDLYSYTTEAGMLTDNGASIQAEYGGIFVSSATATREVKVYFGGTVIYDSGALSITTSSQWTIYASLIRVSSTVVRYMVSIVVDGVTLTSPCSAGELTGLTLSSTNILKITGQAASTGAATNDIVGKLGAVYYWPVSV